MFNITSKPGGVTVCNICNESEVLPQDRWKDPETYAFLIQHNHESNDTD